VILRHSLFFLLLLTFLSLTLSCAPSSSSSPLPTYPYAVLKQYGSLNDSPALGLQHQKVVHNLVAVNQLRTALLALPPFPSGVLSCPADVGSYFEIDFVASSTQTTVYRVDRTGCQGVYLGQSTSAVLWAYGASTFFSELQTLLSS
jgi:hypothetical protein